MQLKTPANALRLGLMAATCALLSPPVVQAADAPEDDGPWQVDAGLLFYQENDGRVHTFEPVVNVRRDLGDEHVVGFNFAFDSLSGGSPNGAIPSKSKVQTFATPSGTSLTPGSSVPQTYVSPSGNTYTSLAKVTLYTVQPGALPLDPGFHDRRIAFDANWSQPLAENVHGTVGGHLSDELDFDSLAVNGALSRDFNAKNTTLSFGMNAELDYVKPIGGVPVGGSDYAQLLKTNNKSKHVLGALLGLTQVMTRQWVTQLNYSYDRSRGYLTDPYKILSIVDSTGNLMSVSSTTATSPYRFENRPGTRTRQALYVGNKVALGRQTLDVSYRYGKDDWQVKSNTVDGRLRVPFHDNWYVEPHVRWYRQTSADFYRLYLNEADAIPQYMSADPRLAAFTATTVGFKVGVDLGDSNELSFRFEQYQQKASDRFSSLVNLQGLDLNPALKATIVMIGWKMEY